jgi:hypothetical protein
MKAPASIIFYLLLGLFVGGTTSCKQARADFSEPQPSIFDWLSTPDPLQISILTSIDSLLLHKDSETYQEAQISYVDQVGATHHDMIRLSARGQTRKNICSFPPLRLKWSGDSLSALGLARYKTLKLVMPCQQDSVNEDYVMREYLCYQICQLLTGFAFRVQLVHFDIRDIAASHASLQHFGFLIEHEDQMAMRMGGHVLENTDEKIKSINADCYNRLTLFQYLIGNTDWNLAARHNIKLVSPGSDMAPLPIPYDFDYSGLVNASYALPHPELPIEKIRDRLFQWRGKDTSTLAKTISLFRTQKEAVFQLIASQKYLTERSRQDVSQYVQAFYELIEKEDAIAVLVDGKN